MTNWKIKRDPFYSELYEKYGREFIDDAGFFEDTAKTDVNVLDSINLLCTPIEFLKPRLETIGPDEKPAVLLLTGSLCPVHDGHREMMHKAFEMCPKLGLTPIGGYYSPGHEEYVAQKTKDGYIPTHKRIQLINDIEDDFTSVDPWEAVFNQVAVNFTDVIVRLEAYLEKHLGRKIEVVYVCGGDNMRFAKTFLHKGYCIVCSRPKYDAFGKYFDEIKDKPNIQIVFMHNEESSTSVRKRAKWLYKKDKVKQLFLRNDAVGGFWHKLPNLLQPYFSHIKPNLVSNQKQELEKMPANIINLDSVMTKLCKNNIQVSRRYDLFGINKLEGLVNRPGSESIDEQISKIEPGDYYLFDDDIHTGGTMRTVENILRLRRDGINIIGNLCFTTSKPEIHEILDARDFKVGHSNGGLVIKLPNGVNARAPYIYPYVCPYTRASISDPMKFSIDVWKINMESYERVKHVTLGQIRFKELYNYVGFSDDTPMYDLCKWHYDLLSSYYNK